ncbi:PREDICTED: serine-rich coiled-coil domain-containing protein 1 [Nanorana parkeri]|uniref:serine-rich coiled-coil domain-containing protein 1 n=1 Tax=Nanorana parkeri TaxID=125878 RepID=UPI000854A430|nr:PREDICTED: serine-rich coiled-coil domain-containing protein 1 [Nanorana parkeri]
MGDLGTRRSTIVSRLPIFRRSTTRKQDSLPSSPSSNNGLHTSSPSSTNSSSGSTGKRRSIFRTPSLSFHHRKESNHSYESSQVPTISQSPQSTLQSLELEEQTKAKARTSTSIPSSCRKITRSVTEDFGKRKEHSVSKNVFTNCLGKNEADDSGFVDDQPKRAVKHSSRKLLPRSFSSHYRFSKHGSRCQTPPPEQNSGCSAEALTQLQTDPVPAKSVLHCATEVNENTESSLLSPLLSADHTTAPQTPSDFIFMDDSASEADSLPISGNQRSEGQQICNPVSTSQGSANPASVPAEINKELHAVKDMSICDGLVLTKQKAATVVKTSGSNICLASSKELIPMSELPTGHDVNLENGTEQKPIDRPVFQNGNHFRSIESLPKKFEAAVSQSEVMSTLSTHQSVPETKVSSEAQYSQMRNGHARVNYASSFSPYRDGRYSERRLRSSSEGTAGGSSMAFKPKEQHSEELPHFRKQRTISTSSKMNSMDVLNNLGSCELDEDDLMLDLEFTEEQQLRKVCREDSFQSIVSCSAVVFSHVEESSEKKQPTEEGPKISETTKRNLYLHLPRESDQEDTKCPRVCQVPTSPSVEWPFAQEDINGLESLPFRLMMQDCTSVKTLLLKMKRILQESTEMSPASSTASLPISPIAERNHPFKDIMKDECSMLKLQLKERDELIHQLQEELRQCSPNTLSSVFTPFTFSTT